MKKKLLCVLMILCVLVLTLSACSSSTSKYNYKSNGIPGLEGALTLEMGYEEFEENLDYESIEYYKDMDIAEGVPFFVRYSASTTIPTSSGNNAMPYINIDFTGSDSDYTNVVDKLTEELGEPLSGTDLLDDTLVCNYISWDIDKSHNLAAYVTKSGKLYVTCSLINSEGRSIYEQCMKNISGNDDLSETYDAMLDHYALLGSSIQLAIDKYGAEWDDSDNVCAYFTESGELFGQPGFYRYRVENPDYDGANSDFIGQIENTSISFHFDEDVDTDAMINELSDMFGEYTIKSDEDTGEISSYQWKESPVSVTFYPSTPSVSWELNDDFYLIAPDLINELNEREVDKTPVDKEILQLPDFELTGGTVTNSDTKNVLWEMTQEEVLKNLKSPSSAEFPSVRDVSIKHTGSLYYIESYVSSQNSFGAMIRTDFLALFEKTDNGFKYMDLQFYN